jgi:hypothetical protein
MLMLAGFQTMPISLKPWEVGWNPRPVVHSDMPMTSGSASSGYVY